MREIAKAICVPRGATLLEAIAVIERGAQAIAFVTDAEQRVLGTLTDGDVRRALLTGATPDARCLESAMRSDFVWVSPETSRAEVLDLMRARRVDQIPVLDEGRRLAGMHSVRGMLHPATRPNWAVLLAGGRGIRLRPLTETIPKPMLRVAGRPILERLVLHCMGHGITEFFVSVNYLAHVIEDHFGDGSRFGCRVHYLREAEPLGTGGPLSLLPPAEHPVLVLNGDLVTQCNLERMLAFHERGGWSATFGVRPHSIAVPFGVARTAGDRLIELREKPSEQMLINAGMYVLSPAAVARVPSGIAYPITDLFTGLLDAQMPVGAYLIDEDWTDVGQHNELLRARGVL